MDNLIILSLSAEKDVCLYLSNGKIMVEIGDPKTEKCLEYFELTKEQAAELGKVLSLMGQ